MRFKSFLMSIQFSCILTGFISCVLVNRCVSPTLVVLCYQIYFLHDSQLDMGLMSECMFQTCADSIN